MAVITLTQTDTSLTNSYTSQCATAANGDAEANPIKNDATNGGTAGSTETTVQINKGNVQDGVFFGSGAINNATWPGGSGNEVTFRLDVTSNSGGDISVTRVSACRMNSSGASQATYGTWTGTRSLATNQVESFTLATTAQSASASDWILFIVEMTNNQSHADSTVGITPSQDIDTNITELSPVTVNATSDSLTLTPVAQTVTALVNTTVNQTADSLTLTPVDQTVTANVNLTVNATSGGALSLTPFDSTVSISKTINATSSSLTLIPFDQTIQAQQNTTVTATQDALTLTPVDQTVHANVNLTVTATAGALSITPVDQSVQANIDTNVSTTSGSLTMTPFDAVITVSPNGTYISATSASLTVTPFDQSVQANVDTTVSVTQAGLILSAVDQSIILGDSGTITVTSATLRLRQYNVRVFHNSQSKSLQDEIYATMGFMLGNTTQANDIVMSWLRDKGATAGDIQGAWNEYLDSEGVSDGQLQDRWSEWLIGLGYAGSVPDMFYQHWSAGG